jgi:hypothetical protein
VVGWADEGDAEAKAVRNLALAYEKSVPTTSQVLGGCFEHNAATVFFGITVIMLAVRVTVVSPVSDPQNPPPEPVKPTLSTPRRPATPQSARLSPAREPDYRNDPRPVSTTTGAGDE